MASEHPRSVQGFEIKSLNTSRKKHQGKKLGGRHHLEDHFDRAFEKMEDVETKIYNLEGSNHRGTHKNAPIENLSNKEVQSDEQNDFHEISRQKPGNVASTQFKNKCEKRSNWVPNKSVKLCYSCSKKFTFFTRKHHCRI